MNKKRSWVARNVVLIFIPIYICISAILIYRNIKDNDLICVDFSKYSTLNAVYSEKAISVLSIIITIVSILFTLSISVVTLLLSRTNIKLTDYLKLVTKKDGSLLLLGIILLNTIVSLFIIYQPYTILLDILLKFGIVPPAVFFAILLKNFEIIDKEEKMKDHLVFILNSKKNFFIDFLLKITKNSFSKEFYSILIHVMKETKTTDKEYLFSINKEIVDKKEDIDIDYILEIQSIIVPLAEDSLFDDLQKKYLEISFSNYRKIMFKTNTNYNNFIMKVKSHLYANILYNERLNPEQEKKLLINYLNLMFRSYELVIIILGKNNLENTREAINDFLGLVQFFTVNKMVNRNPDINIDKMYNYHLVGIVCWILNRIIITNLSIEYIDIIKTLLIRIKEIDISEPETDMFEEIITDIGFHEIRYTRTFFIALSLIFLEESNILETLEKVHYDKTYNNNHYLFKRIIDVYGDVTTQEKRALNFPQDEFDSRAKKIIQIIEAKMRSVIREQNENIAHIPINQEILEKEIKNIEKELSLLISDNHVNFVEGDMKFITQMPRRYLIGDHSSIFIGMNIYRTSILSFFYKNFIANYESIKISKISDITNKNTSLIMSAYLNDYIFQHTEYSYKDEGIEIDGMYYPIIWIQARGPIITLKNLVDFIHLPQNAVTIKLGEDKEQDGELYTECEVSIKYYKSNYSEKRIGYSIL
jgi:hypothetical protein